MEAAEDFYIGKIGLNVVYRKTWDADFRMDTVLGLKNSSGRITMLQNNSIGVEIFCFDDHKILPPVKVDTDLGWMHICFAVSDLGSLYRNWLGDGIKFLSPPSLGQTGNWAAYARDPFGNLLEFVEYGTAKT